MQSTPVRNLPSGTGPDHAARQVIRRFGLRHAAAAHVRKDLRQQKPGDEAHERRDGEQAQTRRSQAKQPVAGLFDRQREQDGGESGQHADDDRQDEKDLILAQPELLRTRQCRAHRVSAPWRRPISSSA